MCIIYTERLNENSSCQEKSVIDTGRATDTYGVLDMADDDASRGLLTVGCA